MIRRGAVHQPPPQSPRGTFQTQNALFPAPAPAPRGGALPRVAMTQRVTESRGLLSPFPEKIGRERPPRGSVAHPSGRRPLCWRSREHWGQGVKGRSLARAGRWDKGLGIPRGPHLFT